MSTNEYWKGYAPELKVTPGNPEAQKYGKLWEMAEYRAVAPGETFADYFIAAARPAKGARVIDFGCGTGRGARKLAQYPLNVTMLDFARNCLDEDVKSSLTSLNQQGGYSSEPFPAPKLYFIKADLEKPIPVTAEYGFCFAEGTVVIGDNENIENLTVDSQALNQQGKRQRILKTFKRSHTGDMVRLRVACLPDVLLTPEHPVLVSSMRRIHRGDTYGGKISKYEWLPSIPAWKPAGQLKKGDWVVVPRITETENSVINFRLAGGGNGRKNSVTTFVESDVDAGIAWLLGFYVAEGHTSHARITLSLNKTESDLANRAISEFARLHVLASIRHSPSIQAMNGMRVVADCVGLAQVLGDWCGRGALNKKVPEAIELGSESVVRSFLLGLVDGDGCIRRDNRNGSQNLSITTISKRLALGVLSLLHKLGVHAAVTMSPARQGGFQGRIVNAHDSYVVKWSKRSWDNTKSAHLKAKRIPYGAGRFIAERVYLPLRKTSKEHVVNLPVYNLSTEDETYPVPFIAHNCTDVMEHIPPDKVGVVLDNILHAAQSVWFSIALFQDRCGKLIGETLHLSIYPFEWWKKQFEDRDCIIHVAREGGDNYAHFYVKAWQDGKAIVDIGVLNTEQEQIRANVKHNCAQGWQQVQPHEQNDFELMIVGGGPSLAKFEDEIKKNRADGVKLLTLNGAYNWAVRHGITPSAQIIVDARPFNARFVEPVVDNCKYLISSQCHPSVFENLPKDRTFIWHTSADIIQDILKEAYPERDWWTIPGGSTVLLRAIPLMRMLGYRQFILYGCDSCVVGDNHHAYEQKENENEPTFPVIVNPGGRIFQCTTWMISQCQEFIDLIRYLGDEIELDVKGDGLLAHILNVGAEQADLKTE